MKFTKRNHIKMTVKVNVNQLAYIADHVEKR